MSQCLRSLRKSSLCLWGVFLFLLSRSSVVSCAGSTSSTLLRRMRKRTRRSTMMRRRSRVSLLIGVLVGGAGSWLKVPVALAAAGAPSRTTNQSFWVLLPVPGAGKIYWGHGLPGDSTGAVPGQVVHARRCWEARGEGFLVVVSGAVGQTMQNTVVNPQLQFWDKVCMAVAAGLVPVARQLSKLWRSRSCRSSQSFPVVPQRQIPMVLPVRKTMETPQLQYVSGCSSWTRSCLPVVVHAKGFGPDCATRELHVQFLDKVDMPSWSFDRCRVQPAVFPPSSAHRCECSRALGVALTPGVSPRCLATSCA